MIRVQFSGSDLDHDNRLMTVHTPHMPIQATARVGCPIPIALCKRHSATRACGTRRLSLHAVRGMIVVTLLALFSPLVVWAFAPSTRPHAVRLRPLAAASRAWPPARCAASPDSQESDEDDELAAVRESILESLSERRLREASLGLQFLGRTGALPNVTLYDAAIKAFTMPPVQCTATTRVHGARTAATHAGTHKIMCGLIRKGAQENAWLWHGGARARDWSLT